MFQDRVKMHNQDPARHIKMQASAVDPSSIPKLAVQGPDEDRPVAVLIHEVWTLAADLMLEGDDFRKKFCSIVHISKCKGRKAFNEANSKHSGQPIFVVSPSLSAIEL